MKFKLSFVAGLGACALAVAGLAYVATASANLAPDISYTQLDGRVERLADLRGKVVLVNFWATSCTTCVKEMPDIISTYQKYHPQGYETVAISMSYDPPAYVMNFAETRKLPFKVAIDNVGTAAASFGDIKLTPTSILINKRGEIVKRYVGEPDFASLHKLIEKLLTQS